LNVGFVRLKVAGVLSVIRKAEWLGGQRQAPVLAL
jgi:hypothetical protein